MRFVNDVLSVTQRSFLSHKIALKELLRYESFKPRLTTRITYGSSKHS